jgi:outer membrane protein TolC
LTKSKVGQAEIQLQKIKGQRLLAEKVLSLQVDQLQATLKELGERLGIYKNAIREAQERMNLASDGYAAGITEYEDLLQAQKSEIELKAGFLQALFLYQVSKAEIESLSGGQ